MPRDKASTLRPVPTRKVSDWNQRIASTEQGVDQNCGHLSFLKGAVIGNGTNDVGKGWRDEYMLTGAERRQRELLRRHTVEQGMSTFTRDEFRNKGDY